MCFLLIPESIACNIKYSCNMNVTIERALSQHREINVNRRKKRIKRCGKKRKDEEGAGREGEGGRKRRRRGGREGGIRDEN